MLWQEKSTTGKQGLGIKDRPKKVAGCYFQGKKKSFDDSDEDSADNDSLEQAANDDLIKVEKIVEGKVKLKKLCKQILQQVRLISCFASIFFPLLGNSWLITFCLITGAWRIIETETAQSSYWWTFIFNFIWLFFKKKGCCLLEAKGMVTLIIYHS